MKCEGRFQLQLNILLPFSYNPSDIWTSGKEVFSYPSSCQNSSRACPRCQMSCTAILSVLLPEGRGASVQHHVKYQAVKLQPDGSVRKGHSLQKYRVFMGHLLSQLKILVQQKSSG